MIHTDKFGIITNCFVTSCMLKLKLSYLLQLIFSNTETKCFISNLYMSVPSVCSVFSVTLKYFGAATPGQLLTVTEWMTLVTLTDALLSSTIAASESNTKTPSTNGSALKPFQQHNSFRTLVAFMPEVWILQRTRQMYRYIVIESSCA